MRKPQPLSNQPWEQFFVRHVVPGKRGNISVLMDLLRLPFESRSGSSCDNGSSQSVALHGRGDGHWVIGARFARLAWWPVYGNGVRGEELFTANAPSRRLEIAWVGCDPRGRGWFVQIQRAGTAIVRFAQPLTGGPTEWQADELSRDFLAGADTGQQAFKRLCAHFEIPLAFPRITGGRTGFEVIGVSGKPIKAGLLGYVQFNGPPIIEGNPQAAKALARAIERCDPEGIRQAVADGASLDVLADSHCSPLVAALFKCDRKNGRECAEVLVELGCPVNGRPHEGPPLVELSQHFIHDELALPAVELLLAHGADVNAADPDSGETALVNAAIHNRTALVRLLMNHGADANVQVHDRPLIDRVRECFESATDPDEKAEWAETLSLLTGEVVEPPALEPLAPDLQAENAYFARCVKARLVQQVLPRDVQLRKLTISRVETTEPFAAWHQELLDAGFELAGDYRLTVIETRFLRAFVHPRYGYEAILSRAESRLAPLRCEIQGYHEDGSLTTVANYHEPADPDIRMEQHHRDELPGASPAALVQRLRIVVRNRAPLLPLAVASFHDRYAAAMRRILQELRAKAEALTAPPEDADPSRPRYQRLGYFLDLSGHQDPTWSTRRLTATYLEDLAEGRTAELSEDRFPVELAILAAGGLVALRHFQFAGAPAALDFLDEGIEVALRYFDALQRKRSMHDCQFWFEAFCHGLLLAQLAGRWDDVQRLCESLRPAVLNQLMSDEFPQEYAKVLFLVASSFRRRPFPGVGTWEREVAAGHPTRPRRVLAVWRAIVQHDQAALDQAMHASLQHFIAHPRPQRGHGNPRDDLPIAESILWATAVRKGMEEPALPVAERELVITPRSIGISGPVV